MRYSRGMKIIFLIVTLLALNSCNTLIGLGRDTKQGYEWTKSKFQGSDSQPNEELVPVY